jgi:hypothetical protein
MDARVLPWGGALEGSVGGESRAVSVLGSDMRRGARIKRLYVDDRPCAWPVEVDEDKVWLMGEVEACEADRHELEDRTVTARAGALPNDTPSAKERGEQLDEHIAHRMVHGSRDPRAMGARRPETA